MRVFVVGATGVLGRRVVAKCVDSGHEVVGMTRDDRGDRIVRERGGQPHRGAIFDRDSLLDGADGADVLVHAATNIPTETNPDGAEWDLNDRIRREGTENLVETATAVGADRLLLQSIVWVARQPDGREFDERSEPNPDRTTRSALEAERLLLQAGEDHEFEPVVLRCGIFYAPDAAHTRLYGQRLLARSLPIIGRGVLGRMDATLSFVHADDAGRAFAAAIKDEATGVFHVVDDEPVTWARFLNTLATELDAPTPRRVPAWLARLLIDEHLVDLLVCSMPTTSARFRELFDWTPTYPTIDEGLAQVVTRWRERGLVRETGDGYDWTGIGEESKESNGDRDPRRCVP
jgi:nucleoside-diphosphate-sugar epimerase